jgi:hypothetical protein
MALHTKVMLEKESYNEAITMAQNRERVVKEMALIMNYIELTPEQKSTVEKIKAEIQELDAANIEKLAKDMEDVKYELDVVSSQVRFNRKYNPYHKETSAGNVVDTTDSADA